MGPIIMRRSIDRQEITPEFVHAVVDHVVAALHATAERRAPRSRPRSSAGAR